MSLNIAHNFCNECHDYEMQRRDPSNALEPLEKLILDQLRQNAKHHTMSALEEERRFIIIKKMGGWFDDSDDDQEKKDKIGNDAVKLYGVLVDCSNVCQRCDYSKPAVAKMLEEYSDENRARAPEQQRDEPFREQLPPMEASGYSKK